MKELLGEELSVCVCVGWLVVLACLTSNRKSAQLFQAIAAIMLYISCIS